MKRYWVALAVAVVAVVGGSVTAISDYLSTSSPAGVVAGYFSALASGDAPGALSFGAVPSGDRSFLTTPALRDELAVAQIRDVRVGSMTGSGGTRQAAVGYRLQYSWGSRQVADTVGLVKVGSRWKLADSAVSATVSLDNALQRASFAGTAVPRTVVDLFPGAIPLVFDTAILQLPAGVGVVRFDGSSTADMQAGVSDVGTRAIEAAMASAVTACLTAATPQALCPDPTVNTRAVPASMHGTLIASTLTVAASVQPDSDGKISITGGFQVNGSYRSLNYDNQASTTTGTFEVTYLAHCFATTATSIVWDEQ
jgi:hypothetical protein